MQTKIDLVDYLTSKGYHVVKHGKSYKIESHSGELSSLSIYPNRQSWKRWSDGTYGGDIIDFLRIVEGMNYHDAVALAGGSLSSIPVFVPAPPSSCELQLPPMCEGKPSRLYAYLCRTRCIDSVVIGALLHQKLAYQDVRGNIVFLGKNSMNVVKFATLHGTLTEVSYKSDCKGSDKKYSFSVFPPYVVRSLCVFESPIDLLSACTVANLVVGRSDAWLQNARLALSGLSPIAIDYQLQMHPEINTLHLWLDNDSAGRSASVAICRRYENAGITVYNHCPQFKDFNDDLRNKYRTA